MSKPSSSPQDQDPGRLVVALNTEEGAAPEWVELIPTGADVQGRDGRSWINDQPEQVVDQTKPRLPFPIDWEHATETRAPQGLDAPAAAWVEEVEAREGGSIWGRVAWTPRGAEQVTNKEYRFLSPGFDFDRTTRRIVRLVHAGLTNTPNLVLTALNREERQDITREKETILNLAERLREALGLNAEATDDDIVAAVQQSRAVNRQADLKDYAPRADLETAINRAERAEADLKALRDQAHVAAVDAAIGKAMDEGKITPASEEQYRAMCRDESGLAAFNALAATLPQIAGVAESRALNKVAADKATDKLTDEERAVCRALGQSEADYLAAKPEAV